MRLDHLLSKEEEVGVVLLLCYQWKLNKKVPRKPEIKREKREGFALLRETARRKKAKRNNTKHISGGDALRGNTRTHPEHEG